MLDYRPLDRKRERLRAETRRDFVRVFDNMRRVATLSGLSNQFVIKCVIYHGRPFVKGRSGKKIFYMRDLMTLVKIPFLLFCVLFRKTIFLCTILKWRNITLTKIGAASFLRDFLIRSEHASASTEFKNVRPWWPLNHETGFCLDLDEHCKELKIAFEYNGIQHHEYTISKFST